MKKSYGQHFLHDQNIIKKIVDAVDVDGIAMIVEVGPGAGALTRGLAHIVETSATRLVLIEADRDLLPALEAEFTSPSPSFVRRGAAHLIHADAVQVDYDAIVGDRPWVFVSNLPYNAGNAILEEVLKAKNPSRQLVVMVQKEVGDRMMAKPGEMSLLSVAIQLYVDVKRVCVVKPGAFTPPPKVDSVVLTMRPVVGGDIDRERVIDFARVGFAHRRKQLRATLIQAGVSSGEKIDQALTSLGYSVTVRPQEVAVADWVKLFQIVR